MRARGVFGRGERALLRRLPEPLIGRELIGHQPQTRIRLQGD